MSTELYHEGIKNQKWGVRRFQYPDPDRRWTPAGKIRYGKGGSHAAKETKEESTQKKHSYDNANKNSTTIVKSKKEASTIEDGHRIEIDKKKALVSVAVGAAVIGGVFLGSQIIKNIKYSSQYAKYIDAYHDYLAKNGSNDVDFSHLTLPEANNRTQQWHRDRAERYIQSYRDKIIPKGTEIGNISENKEFYNGAKMFWGSTDQDDKDFYTTVHTKFTLHKKNNEDIYMRRKAANKDATIAGRGAASQTLRELYDSDPTFREDFWNRVNARGYMGSAAERKAYKKFMKAYSTSGEEFSRHFMQEGYDLYNVSLIDNDKYRFTNGKTVKEIKSEESNKFIDKLIDKGYAGMVDVNDIKYSSFSTKTPGIFFNGSNSFDTLDSKLITAQERKNLNKKKSGSVKEYITNRGANTLFSWNMGLTELHRLSKSNRVDRRLKKEIKHYYCVKENTLQHSGVKGQQKGVRNYQNEDGTWTELGKERRRAQYESAESVFKGSKQVTDSLNQYVKNMNTIDNIVDYSKYAKEISGMSDEELRTINNRMSLENNYARLMEDRNNNAIRQGRATTTEILTNVGTVVGIAGGVVAIMKALD